MAKLFVMALALLLSLLVLVPSAQAQGGPGQGPGGPILVVTSGAPTFGTYYAEILRTEGLNAFAVADISSVTPATLAAYDVVVLSKMALTADKVIALTDWVNAGGNLIAMAPDAQLAGLLGVTPVNTTLSNAYLLVNTSAAPGNGIVNQTIQFHGAADLYTLNGASSVATLYSSANTATANPAVTLRAAGLGMAAAFTYDLASSVVYTRQGNPAWAADERDGFAPIRSDDKFFGNKVGDVQADWVDLNKVAIPQADEQQRLLANLIIHMNSGKKPLPRFWYFPNGKKAVVIMTGDDHGNGGTVGRFNQFKTLDPPGCSLANWECIRGTSYVYPSTPMTDAQAVQFASDGFEVGLHVNPGCVDFDLPSLQATYAQQVADFQTKFPGLGALKTQRHHCAVWSDWSSAAQVQLSYGMRLDTTYYFYPPSWVGNAPGLFTGSGMPMRFTKLDGSFVDVYQAATQMTDESLQTYPFTVDTLLDRALGVEGYFGAFAVNAHTDSAVSPVADAVVSSALARSVPIVASQQMLTWLDARNSSSFGALAFNAGTLAFSIAKDASAAGLQAMLPTRAGAQVLSGITRNGTPVTFSVSPVKGIEYAFFAADGGSYAATYAVDLDAPVVNSTSPAAGATGVSVTVRPAAVFGEAMDPSSVNAGTVELRNAANGVVSAAVTYDAATRSAILVPGSPLAESSTYTVTLRGGSSGLRVRDAAGISLAASYSWSFTTGAGALPPTCPCGAWNNSSTPANPSAADPNAIEVGVKFTSDVAGFVTGLRFFKGAANTGTHVGNLWTIDGTQLASATFTGETASGWQQVSFASPVAITANTVYVASYFAPNGNYAGDNDYFVNTGVNNPPVRLLKDGVYGGNGVYSYGAASTFPSSSYRSTNYWVDVVFNTVAPADTTPPTVSSVSPGSGSTEVGVSSAMSVVFSEAVDPATISTNTFELRATPSNALLTGTVAYNAVLRTATFTPNGPLTTSATYTATIKGGVSNPRVTDLAGNALSADVAWSFTTSTGTACPCGIWDSSSIPTTPSWNDQSAIQVGVKFKSDLSGFITGIRFYKGASNTGTHVGNLWTTAGTPLASAVFTAKTATGWQQVNFASPVAIAANTVYVASYFAPNGNYAADPQYFANNGVDVAPLHLLKNGVSGGNGVYAYGSATTFPGLTFGLTNYWVDVVFTTAGAADTTAPTVTTTSPVINAVGVSPATAVAASFSELIDPSTIGSDTFELVSAAGVPVAGLVSYDPTTLVARFTPSNALLATTTYIATLKGGTGGPRVQDLVGNALAANVTWSFSTGSLAGTCATPANETVGENCRLGNPPSEWDVIGAGDASIQGFATQISVNRGTSVSFKVNTNADNYRFDIYRMGYYGGLGARKVATVQPSAALPQTQPSCLSDATTGLVDCGNWAVSGTWAVPADAVSGIYFARPVRADSGGASHIVFVVRDDSSTSDLLFKTSDATWQAYNDYGGNSLYSGSPAGRAYKVSYNRPFRTRGNQYSRASLFGAEYPMVRWLEANGYGVSYIATADAARSGSLLLNHRVFLSVGHDEYWSAAERTSVEAARNAGIHLAFFSGNEMFWKTRWENSIDASATPYRTLVSYKETHAGAKIDPTAIWTGTWRDPRFSPPADGGRPENAITGTIWTVNCCEEGAIVVPSEEGKLRLWRNTSVSSLGAGQSATLAAGTLGYEWDSDLDNGSRPRGLIRLSSTTRSVNSKLIDFGSNFAPGDATHSLTMYRHTSGALVFGAGTVRWSWGLDTNHDFDSATPNVATAPDLRMQQATVNLFADMNVQPGTLQAGLGSAAASADGVSPVSTIAAPTQGAQVPGNGVTISGTASDSGGGVVGAVEVSTDGGATWHPATGRSSWTYSWAPTVSGSAVIMSRAVDDSGNVESPSSGVSVTVAARTCPCTIWPATATPAIASNSVDTRAVNLGVKFKSDTSGFITGLRFYKGAGNNGTHVGTLWTGGGTPLGTATFTGESATGWQQVNFTTPVAITANTVYVASYLSPNGGWAVNTGYFETQGVDNVPLHALSNGTAAGNGVYAYSADTSFPNLTYSSSNYWVDVVFTTDAPADTTAPLVTSASPSSGATGVGIGTTVTATFSEAMNAGTITNTSFALRNGAALIPAVVTYNPTTFVATLTPSTALPGLTTYDVTVLSGASGVTDTAGNALALDRTWSFTTAAVDVTPPTVTLTSPLNGTTGVSGTANVTVTFSEALDATTVNSTTFELRDSANALVAAVVTYDAATRVATLNPTPTLTQAATYTATIKGGGTDPRVKDTAGNALAADLTWSFTIAADTTAPTVAKVTPLSAATGVATNSVVTATFSEAMDASTVNGTTFLLNPGSGPVAATVVYNPATFVATLTPSNALVTGTLYTVTVTAGAAGVKDLAGNPLAAKFTWKFTTTGADVTPPTVTVTSPLSGAIGVSGTANVSATFSETMTATTINSTTFELRDPLNNLVAAAVTYSATTQIVTLNPTPTLAPGTVYTATIRGGGTDPRVKDAGDNALAANLSWSFTIAPDTTPPTVSSISPATGAASVSATANVTATFNEVMDLSSISASTFELRDPGNNVVPAVVSYNATTRVATLNPTPNLVGGTVYTAIVRGAPTGVKDAAGTVLAVDKIWTFTVESTPPTVTSTTPANGATGFSTTSNVTANFSEVMDPATVNTGTVELRDPGGALVASVVTLSTNGFTVTLNPTPTLAKKTVYTVTVKGGVTGPRVKDLASNSLATDRIWTFTTK